MKYQLTRLFLLSSLFTSAFAHAQTPSQSPTTISVAETGAVQWTMPTWLQPTSRSVTFNSGYATATVSFPFDFNLQSNDRFAVVFYYSNGQALALANGNVSLDPNVSQQNRIYLLQTVDNGTQPITSAVGYTNLTEMSNPVSGTVYAPSLSSATLLATVVYYEPGWTTSILGNETMDGAIAFWGHDVTLPVVVGPTFPKTTTLEFALGQQYTTEPPTNVPPIWDFDGDGQPDWVLGSAGTTSDGKPIKFLLLNKGGASANALCLGIWDDKNHNGKYDDGEMTIVGECWFDGGENKVRRLNDHTIFWQNHNPTPNSTPNDFIDTIDTIQYIYDEATGVLKIKIYRNGQVYVWTGSPSEVPWGDRAGFIQFLQNIINGSTN